MSEQTRHDEERGISARHCIQFALMVIFGGPKWKLVKAADTIDLVLRKMGFKIVPMERADYER